MTKFSIGKGTWTHSLRCKEIHLASKVFFHHWPGVKYMSPFILTSTCKAAMLWMLNFSSWGAKPYENPKSRVAAHLFHRSVNLKWEVSRSLPYMCTLMAQQQQSLWGMSAQWIRQSYTLSEMGRLSGHPEQPAWGTRSLQGEQYLRCVQWSRRINKCRHMIHDQRGNAVELYCVCSAVVLPFNQWKFDPNFSETPLKNPLFWQLSSICRGISPRHIRLLLQLLDIFLQEIIHFTFILVFSRSF